MRKHTEWQLFNRIELTFEDEQRTYSPVEMNIVKFVLPTDDLIAKLPDGHIVEVKIFSSTTTYQLRTVCLLTHDQKGKTSFMYLSTNDVQGSKSQDKLNTVRLKAFDQALMGWTNQPWFIGSKFKFTVVEIFTHGLTISFDPSPNYILVPDVLLTLTFPNERSGFSKLFCKVLSSVTENGVCETRLSILKVNRLAELRSFYHQLMSSYENLNLKILQKLEAPLPFFQDNIKVSIAESAEDFTECFELRRAAYSSKPKSKLTADMPLEKFTDAYDKLALVFKFNYFHQTVGTARLIAQTENAEIGSFTTIPDFIREGGFIEISRLATHESYRGRDLFLLVLQVFLKIGFLLDKQYVLFDCEDHLLPVYKKIGAIPVDGHEIIHPMEGVRLNLVFIDIKKAIEGKRMPFVIYFFGLIPLQHHMIETGNLKANVVKKMWVSFLFLVSQNILSSQIMHNREVRKFGSNS